MKNDYSDDGDAKGERGTGRLAEQGIPAAVDRLGGRVQQVFSQTLFDRSLFKHACVSSTYPMVVPMSVRWSLGPLVDHTFEFPLPLKISVQQSSLMIPLPPNPF